MGNAGNDLLSGWNGGDTLEGKAGDDVLLGSSGNDILVGGLGHDSLTGGRGYDTFVIDGSDLATSADVIVDFSHGVDTVSLQKDGAGLFNGLAAVAVPDQIFKLTGQALDADDRLIYDGFDRPDCLGRRWVRQKGCRGISNACQPCRPLCRRFLGFLGAAPCCAPSQLD